MSAHNPLCDKAWSWPDAMSGRGTEAADCWLCDIIAKVRADERTDAARDLRLWIRDNYPSIKGYSDVNVEEALTVVEGKP